MKHGHFAEHWLAPTLGSPVHMPAGGVSTGRGFTISWQNGPLGRGNTRQEPNGAFVEDVIQAVIERIEFYQHHFPCQENEDALLGLYQAAQRLDDARLRGRINTKG